MVMTNAALDLLERKWHAAGNSCLGRPVLEGVVDDGVIGEKIKLVALKLCIYERAVGLKSRHEQFFQSNVRETKVIQGRVSIKIAWRSLSYLDNQILGYYVIKYLLPHLKMPAIY